MTRRLLHPISCLLVLVPLLGISQDCGKIKTWIDRAEGYAVGIDVNILDAFTIMKLTSPAFHDELFKPVFGKVYANLTDSDKKAIQSKLMTCGNDKAFVGNGLVTAFESGSMTTSWSRQVAAINNSSVAENDRILKYESRIRARNQVQQRRVAQQKVAYDKRRATTRSRNRTGSVQIPQNPNAYNASPKDRKNTAADYQKEAAEMKTYLTYIKNNSAPAHRFTGYNNSGLMQKVYDGDFEGFPLGLNDMREKNLLGGLSKVSEIKKYERFLIIYLESFSSICASKNMSKYKKVKIQYEVIETQNHISSSKGFTKPEIYYMKPHFEKDFRRIHRVISNAAPIDAIWMLASSGETGLDFGPDVKELFKKHQCESPIIRQLETNLYLASKGKSSLQKLLPYVNN